jgi:hypothetical protein
MDKYATTVSATAQWAVGTGHTYPSAGTQNKYKQLETAKFWCKKTHLKRPPSKKLTLKIDLAAGAFVQGHLN